MTGDRGTKNDPIKVKDSEGGNRKKHLLHDNKKKPIRRKSRRPSKAGKYTSRRDQTGRRNVRQKREKTRVKKKWGRPNGPGPKPRGEGLRPTPGQDPTNPGGEEKKKTLPTKSSDGKRKVPTNRTKGNDSYDCIRGGGTLATFS